jgi:uncharacterized DUF497 family protein
LDSFPRLVRRKIGQHRFDVGAFSIYTVIVIFAWDDENRDHIARHGVTPLEAEYIVEHAEPPFPQNVGRGKFRVWGRTQSGRILQVIYVLKAQHEISYESIDAVEWSLLADDPQAKVVRVIHAMPLTDDMRRQYRRLRR